MVTVKDAEVVLKTLESSLAPGGPAVTVNNRELALKFIRAAMGMVFEAGWEESRETYSSGV